MEEVKGMLLISQNEHTSKVGCFKEGGIQIEKSIFYPAIMEHCVLKNVRRRSF